jgi:hypothetical protein
MDVVGDATQVGMEVCGKDCGWDVSEKDFEDEPPDAGKVDQEKGKGDSGLDV